MPPLGGEFKNHYYHGESGLVREFGIIYHIEDLEGYFILVDDTKDLNAL